MSLCVFLVLSVRSARAELLQAPIGGHPIAVGAGRVVCGSPGEGWGTDSAGKSLQPPTPREAIGKLVEIRVAASLAECGASRQSVTLNTTDRWPSLEPNSIVLSPDELRVEALGKHLQGAQVLWRNGAVSGVDTCHDPKPDGANERCAWIVGPNMSADPRSAALWLLPAGARLGAEVTTFDGNGNTVPGPGLLISPARVTISRLVPADAAVDLSTGKGQLVLFHPEAVGASDCGQLDCEVSDGKLTVTGSVALVEVAEVKLRLLPHIGFLRKGAAESQPSFRFPVLHCPMSVISGAPVRDNPFARVVLRVDQRCSRELSTVRFLVGTSPLRVVDSISDGSATDVVLQLGPFSDETLVITAVRGDAGGALIAVARATTRSLPPVRTTLELPEYPKLDFIPNNRPAQVNVPRVGAGEHLEVLPIEGVYGVVRDGEEVTVQGDRNADGLVGLRFALRSDALPGALRNIDLAIVTEPVQRPIREANVPIPIATRVQGSEAFIELLCGKEDSPERVVPGETSYFPFAWRDTCRVVFHRERLSVQDGEQKLALGIEVVSADGAARAEGHVTETVRLRASNEPRVAWIHGVKNPFDRIVVRVSHDADEAHYVRGAQVRTGAPDAQWAAIMGSGRLRLYGTSAIPTGLYRFGDSSHSGVLSLNFGVISRLTWLDREGHEGLLGLEGGVMVIGLANSTSTTGQSLTEVGGVFGLGLSVPIANRSSPTQASINLHGWAETPFTRNPDASESRWAFIFGPSISIGNIGADL